MGKVLEYFNGDDLAANVWKSKYMAEGEITPDCMHKRLAKEFFRVDEQYQKSESKLSKTESKWQEQSNYGQSRKPLTEQAIYEYFKNFEYIIPQGSIMAQLGVGSIGSLSNCFVIGQPHDSFGGIFQKDEEMAQLMKRRGGVGLDLSTLAPQGRKVSNAAKSSTGAVSFMSKYSETTRKVAQGGRRGALMLSMEVNHPDIMQFITIKRDLTKVTGANISIKLNNEFMKAVENNEDYILGFPCTIEATKLYKEGKFELTDYEVLHTFGEAEIEQLGGLKYARKIKAKKYWAEIIKSAHASAEPGLMFWNAMVDYAPDGVYPQYRPVTTNPCSEIGMQPYDACRLIAVNLFAFIDNPFTKKASFNFQKFYEVNYESMRLSDDLVDLELEQIEKILEKIHNDPEPLEVKQRELNLWLKVKAAASSSRRTGLGFTALGDTLAALGFKYDSDESLKLIDEIMATKMRSELDCTIDLALTRGSFTDFDSKMEFIGDAEGGQNPFYQHLVEKFPSQAKKISQYGRRNVSFSTVAPTGSVSLLAQVTSGVEPLFMPYYTRRKKVNANEDVKVDFVDDNGDSWQEFNVVHPKFQAWIAANAKNWDPENPENSKEFLQEQFERSPWFESTANDIDWIKRVEIQSIIQKYISHSISSTINLPKDVSLAEVDKIYMQAWKKNLKGITVYRDGSRSGVLVSDTTDKSKFASNDAPKRPKTLECEVHNTVVKGVKWTVIVGLMNDNPYEVFCLHSEHTHISGHDKLYVSKKARGSYILHSGKVNTKSYHAFSNLVTDLTDEEETITRLVSTALRHGASIKFITEQLNKTKGALTSYGKALSRVLKKYIQENAKVSGENCDDCGSDDLIYEEGCKKCRACGISKCG
ncbi:MAG: adenosylcobalamin-dependent ribonucleoside-diphosphate reductase [Aureispira sp.]|nr:adenosylcobalamin-dependent ribonucleoside-diphosphate reductase [Aureispira sp.]